MDVGRNAAAVVGDGARSVCIQRHGYERVAGQSFVDRIVHHLVDHVVEARSIVIGVADIHAGTFAHGVGPRSTLIDSRRTRSRGRSRLTFSFIFRLVPDGLADPIRCRTANRKRRKLQENHGETRGFPPSGRKRLRRKPPERRRRSGRACVRRPPWTASISSSVAGLFSAMSISVLSGKMTKAARLPPGRARHLRLSAARMRSASSGSRVRSGRTRPPLAAGFGSVLSDCLATAQDFRALVP